MKIVHISDTHGHHKKLLLPKSDILVHSGDFSGVHGAYKEEIEDFLNWFRLQDAKEKILIGGNWDKLLAECEGFEELEFDLSGMHYLCNSSIVIDGVNFFGSPLTPCKFGNPFSYYPGEQDWKMIPENTDVLITHGPAKNILDDGYGCSNLRKRIEIVKPKCHLFGHIHTHSGTEILDGIQFSNAAEAINIINI